MLPDNIKTCHIPLISNLCACDIAFHKQPDGVKEAELQFFFNTRVYFPINIYVHKHKSVQWSEISIIGQIGNSQSKRALSGVGISKLAPVFKSSDPK